MKKNKILGNHGFSLIEILVALLLVSMMFVLVPMGTQEDFREKLETSVDNFDRAIRFAANEAILRNAIVRIKVDLSEEPVKYTVQFGPSGNFVLPKSEDTSRMSLQEKEAYDKTLSELDGQFNDIEELRASYIKLPEGITILGLASSFQKIIKTSGIAAVYFYPTGEKDDAMVFFSSPEELAALKIPAFEQKTTVDYYQYSDNDLATLDDVQENKMK